MFVGGTYSKDVFIQIYGYMSQIKKKVQVTIPPYTIESDAWVEEAYYGIYGAFNYYPGGIGNEYPLSQTKNSHFSNKLQNLLEGYANSINLSNGDGGNTDIPFVVSIREMMDLGEFI